ncbi:hypothetical protein P7C70_g6754, partial [Phenoliferia sp. Uapishka_3]
MWEWRAPNTTLDNVSKSDFSERDFILSELDSEGVIPTRREFKETVNGLLDPESARRDNKMFSTVEGMNTVNNNGAFHSIYRRIPVFLLAAYARNSTPIIFTVPITVCINPHMAPYPIDTEWLRHFREDAARPKALVFHEHYEELLRRLGKYDSFMTENGRFGQELRRTGKLEAVIALLDDLEINEKREDAYLTSKKTKDNAKKKARKLEAKKRKEEGGEAVIAP